MVAIAIGSIAGWFLYDTVVELLLDPYCDYWRTVPPTSADEGVRTVLHGAVDPVLIKLKVSCSSGSSSPCRRALELWRFVVRG